ncbi:MAG: HlyD family efflux transporter periplasmic adaptor subunit [Chloroflexi bacterium]|nr:MAG: HlyD family efflux transporter periplasmic adaptor subunit [Chloroflexota bacterium]
MSKRVIVLFSIVGILIISTAGYLGFSTSEPPEATPTPQTVSVATCDVEQTVTAPGNLINVNESGVQMPATGRISAVNVRVGDQVRKGQTLAELDPVTTSQAQLSLLEAQEELEKLQKRRTALDYPRATNDYIKDLRKQIKAAKNSVSELNDAAKNADDAMVKSQMLASLETAKANLKDLESRLSWYTSKPTENDVVAADSELALAQAKYDAAKAVLESLEIKAGIDGIVFEVAAEAGQTYQAETKLFTIGDPRALEVVANVTEEDYPIISIGQSVEVYFDARPEVTIKGKVERIIPKRIEGDRPRYNIYIALNEVPDGLADGMTADAAITIEKRAGVLCLPRSIVRASGVDEVSLKVWTGTTTETRSVTVGLRGDSDVEILSGVSEGEQVVIQ